VHVVEDTPVWFGEDGAYVRHFMSKDMQKTLVMERTLIESITFLQEQLKILTKSEETRVSPLWKKRSEPVIGGTTFGIGTVFDVSVLRRSEPQLFTMFFSWRDYDAIAKTTSGDGVTWAPPEIVFVPNLESGWEDTVNRPCVVKQGNTLHLWYTGQIHPGNNLIGKSWIGYAFSTNGGKSWERRATPVLTASLPWEKNAVMNAHVIYDEARELWRMWYCGGDQNEPNAIGFATSVNGIHWNKLGDPVFEGSGGIEEWDRDRVAGVQVVWDGEIYTMFYIGYSDEEHGQIGMARSVDGVTNWVRYTSNPIIKRGNPGSFDCDSAYKPFAIFDGRQWLLWYNGRNGNMEAIGLATFPRYDLWL
jgi:hypothetical protein